MSRYQQVVRTLLRYGFVDLVSQPPLSRVPGLGRIVAGKDGTAELEWTRYERIRMALAELGPTFVKLGQVAANRPDLLPPGLIAELEKLQDEVPPMSPADFEAVLDEAYGDKRQDYFAEIDPRPVAAASIAQVHRARLKSGEAVALKVQRRGIRAVIEADIAIMYTLAELVERLLPPDFYARPTEVVRAFEQQIKKELDFKLERTHMEQFRKRFARERKVYIPRTWPEYSTDTVLCMEFIEGIRLSDVEALKRKGIDPAKLARRGIQLYFRQFFEFGLYHADPHPGNIIIRPDGTICLLDFGQVGRLTPYDQELLGELFVAAIQLDARSIRQVLERYAMVEAGEDGPRLEYEINDLIATYADLPIEQIDFRDVAARIF
ncbi:MAG: AarF/ABC1/UbiB kinase family protein, partial [Bacteroidetes bacterium]